MSQENVERLRTALEAYNEDGPEAIIALLDPDIEWIADRSDIGRMTYRGRDGVRKSFEELYEGFDRLGFEVDRLIEEGTRIVVLGRMQARGRSTGVEAQIPLAIVFTAGQDGQLVRYESFRNAGEALEAVGLSESAMSQENVEVVRRFIEALPRAQASDDWQPVLAEVDPDVEIDDLDISLDTERYRGPDSVRKWIGVWMESWDSWRLEDVQVRPVGEDRAIGLFLVHARGKGSGIELSRRDALVCTLRAGKIKKGTYYNDQQQALEAVGLSG